MFGLLIGVLWLLVAGGIAWLLWEHRHSVGLEEANAPGDPNCYRGFFYNNPSDPRLIVREWNGVGWTVNLAHAAARKFLILACGLPVVLALLLVFRG